MKKFTLTGDDLAACEEAAALGIAWMKSGKHARTAYTRTRIARLRLLIEKLSKIGTYAYPYSGAEHLPDFGGEEIMQTDDHRVRATRRRAHGHNRRAAQ